MFDMLQVEQLSSGIDLLVATPGRVLSHLGAGTLELKGCSAIVLDEVDVLLGEK
jgi:superfamily II DNA/RNA helicase